jgi:hypothetical protein
MRNQPFVSKRVTRKYRQSIEASPDRVFRLICPVREAEWLDGWHHTMIHSQSGLVEEGAVFSTPSPGERDTVWVVTRRDPVKRLVEFTRFTPGSRVCVLRISVRSDRKGSLVDIAYTYTGITTPATASPVQQARP